MSRERSGSGAASGGIGVGTVLAVVLSWTTNHSIGWALLHGICGWFYIVYRAIWAPWWTP